MKKKMKISLNMALTLFPPRPVEPSRHKRHERRLGERRPGRRPWGGAQRDIRYHTRTCANPQEPMPQRDALPTVVHGEGLSRGSLGRDAGLKPPLPETWRSRASTACTYPSPSPPVSDFAISLRSSK